MSGPIDPDLADYVRRHPEIAREPEPEITRPEQGLEDPVGVCGNRNHVRTPHYRSKSCREWMPAHPELPATEPEAVRMGGLRPEALAGIVWCQRHRRLEADIVIGPRCEAGSGTEREVYRFRRGEA